MKKNKTNKIGYICAICESDLTTDEARRIIPDMEEDILCDACQARELGVHTGYEVLFDDDNDDYDGGDW